MISSKIKIKFWVNDDDVMVYYYWI